MADLGLRANPFVLFLILILLLLSTGRSPLGGNLGGGTKLAFQLFLILILLLEAFGA